MKTKSTLHLAAALAFAILQTQQPAARAAQFTNGQAADVVLGQPSFTGTATGSGSSQMNTPFGVATDPTTGKVFVVDTLNSRVLRFSSLAAKTSGAAAEAVLGQTGFGSSSGGTTQTKLGSPRAACVDAQGRLWVADFFNSRVLRFENASNRPSGAPADGVLGQVSFTTSGTAAGPAGMSFPTCLACDAAGTLWVSDQGNDRVLRFDNAAAKVNGAAADGVLGKPDFTTITSGSITAATMGQVQGIAVDGDGRLWVVDQFINRVLRFDDAAAKTNGADADGVLGPSNFTSNPGGATDSKFNTPFGTAVDAAGTLFVSDPNNGRILVFVDAAAKANGGAADRVLGQPDFTSSGKGTSATQLRSPSHMSTDAAGRLFVADQTNNRVLRFSPNFPRPRIALTGPRTRATRQSFAFVRGTAGSEAGLAKVEFKVNNGAFRRATGQEAWKAFVILKPGTNTVTVRAVGTDGDKSRALVVAVTRR